MSSFHNSQSVQNQAGHQVIHGDVNFYYDNEAFNQRRRALIGDTEEDRIRRLDDAILRSLAFPQMFDRRSNVELPHTKTCQWIFGRPEYRNWITAKSGLLWIKGKPGSGKSTIMSHLYRSVYCESNVNADDRNVYLDFFFNARGVSLQHNRLGMLRSLLSQLFCQVAQIRDILRKPYQDKNNCFGRGEELAGWEWQYPELELLFSEAILVSARKHQVTIFVDALDEAGEWAAKDIAQYFHKTNDLSSEASASTKICISCRHYPIPTSVKSVEIHVEKHNHDDISAYVLSHISTNSLPGGSEWPDLVAYLIDQARGIFQWVRLVVPMVKKQIDEREPIDNIRDWLSQVPRELQEVYKHILSTVVEPRHWKTAFQLFQWVCLGKRPLSVTEMCYALNIHDSLHSNPDCKVWRDENLESQIKSCSGGLLEVVKTGKWYEIFPDIKIQVSHQSVRDFFMTDGLMLFTTLNGNGPSKIPECHASLYWCCLKYISSSSTVTKPSYEDDPRLFSSRFETVFPTVWEDQQAEMRSKSPFMDYALCSVTTHAEKAEGYRSSNPKEEHEILEKAVIVWPTAQAMIDDNEDFLRIQPKTTALHLAVLLGLVDLVKYQLEHVTDIDVNAPDARGWSSIHYAAAGGHIPVTETLISAGAIVNPMLGAEQSALCTAASKGNAKFFSWFLSQGAKLNGQAHDADRDGVEDALYTAAAKGHSAIVKLCIDAGGLLGAGDVGDSALWAASRTDSVDTVRLLIDAGTDVNAPSYNGGVLQIASDFGSQEVVRLLLDSGADPNARGGSYGNALKAAAASHKDSANKVRFLIEAGADVNDRGGGYGTPLMIAKARGGDSEEIVRLLLEAGARG